jgi:hypothetical protein
MEITVQLTPNPNALKFVLPASRFDQPLSFPSAESATAHPLAQRLFALGDIYNVFMAQDFITVNKLPDVAWEPLRDQIRAILEEHFEGIYD